MIRRLLPGFGLAEATLAIVLVAVLASLAAPPMRRLVEGAAARGARDALAAAVARTRVAAIGAGGATLHVRLDDGSFSIRTKGGATVYDGPSLETAYGAVVSADGAPAPSVAIAFDGLGIGRVASRTLRFRRGGAEARLTISAYGRLRRW
jgi:Tfp pilus assembly protein FimT